MKRPVFLIVVLAFLILTGFYELSKEILYPSQHLLFKIFGVDMYWPLGILSVSGPILLWFWKKIGFYIFVATGMIGLLINVSSNSAHLLFGALFIITLTGVLYLAMRPVWNQFK